MPREGQPQVAVHLGPAQEAQRDLPAHPVALEVQLDRPEGVVAQLHLRRAVGEHQQQRQARAAAPHVGQQVHGGGVGPVYVVEEDDQRPRPRHLLHQGQELPLQALLRGGRFRGQESGEDKKKSDDKSKPS